MPPTCVSSPFTVPPPARPSELRDREKVSTTSVNNSSLAGHRYSNHDRTNTQPSAAATLSTSTVGQEPSSKTNAQFADQTQRLLSGTIDTAVSQPPLRRIKTDSGTLSMSAKQYFERKERERLGRDTVKTELNPVKETIKKDQEPSKSSPTVARLVSKADKVESDVAKGEQNKISGSEFSRKAAEMKPATSLSKQHSTDLKTAPNHDVSSGQNVSLRAHKNLPLSTNRGLGMGDPSDQRPANIFESFRVNDLQQADASLESSNVPSTHVLPVSCGQQVSELTTVSAADNLDLGAILKPEHVHGGYNLELPVFTSSAAVAASAAVTTVQSRNSSLTVSHEHGHHATHSGAVSSVASDKSRQKVHAEHSRERRRSTRHEGSMPLTSPMKLQQVHPADQTSASDVKKHEHEVSRRRRPSNSSQPSPLKMKLSLLPATSQTGSPTIVKQSGDTSASTKVKSQVSSPVLESQAAALSDSQEHIRLKLNLGSGRVKKVPVSNAVASPNPASGMKIVLSKDKVSGEYQHGSTSESGHHHHHHRHHRHHHHHKHSRPDADSHSAHATVSRKRAADFDPTAKPLMDKKLRSELLDNGHQSMVTGRLSQVQPTQTNNVVVSSALSRTHIPSTYRMSSAVLPPPPPPPPLPTEEPAAPPPPPLPPQ